jgi:prephenate dehydrogenase
VAAVSHLPFVLSAALVGAAAKSPQWGDISHLASTGFKDATRLASGDSTMHRDVCITNKESIIYWMDELIIELERIKYVLRSENNSEELFQLFENAFDEREKWLGGMIKPWSKAEYERPKSPSFNRIFFGDRIAGKLFGEDDGKVGGKKN